MSRLIYLMGASGAGKDSVLNATRRALRTHIYFAQRYITRPLNAHPDNLGNTEVHIPLTDAEFDQKINAGEFAMHWGGNGVRYGIDIMLNEQLSAGHTVMVNGSRAYFEQASTQYTSSIYPVLITVSPKQLEHRLKQRGRENEQEIAQRIARSQNIQPIQHERLFVLNNDGELNNTVNAFIDYLNGLTK